jgi:hypothetical protein
MERSKIILSNNFFEINDYCNYLFNVEHFDLFKVKKIKTFFKRRRVLIIEIFYNVFLLLINNK